MTYSVTVSNVQTFKIGFSQEDLNQTLEKTGLATFYVDYLRPYTDYIPGVSTITGLIDLFWHCIGRLAYQTTIQPKNYYLISLELEPIIYHLFRLIPVLGNIIIFCLRTCDYAIIKDEFEKMVENVVLNINEICQKNSVNPPLLDKNVNFLKEAEKYTLLAKKCDQDADKCFQEALEFNDAFFLYDRAKDGFEQAKEYRKKAQEYYKQAGESYERALRSHLKNPSVASCQNNDNEQLLVEINTNKLILARLIVMHDILKRLAHVHDKKESAS